ncbi:hypothetical protein ACO1C7_00400 [Bacillus cereus]|uniref:hypothetical protein n=1 Tax=Bacillus cereus TaxID=1396 RepID=UPI003BF754D0
MSKRVLEGLKIEDSDLVMANWPQVLIENLTEEELNKFLIRKKAIDLFMTTNTKIYEIEQQVGIHRSEIYRLIRRCLEKDEFEQIMGYRGLVPYKRLKDYNRNDFPMTKADSKNFSGAFNLLLDTYPTLKELIINSYFSKKTKGAQVTEPIINIKNLHKKFIDDVGIWE